jgi:hypothetical protein
MRPRRSRIMLALVLVALAALGLFAWRPVQQVWALAALQACIEGGVAPEMESRSLRFPDAIDRSITKAIEQRAAGSGRERDHVRLYHALFAEPIDKINLYAHAFHGDPGVALARFPRLSYLYIYMGRRETPTEEELTQLCRALRGMPQLQSIVFWGDAVTNVSLAPLAGHPTLRELTICKGPFTAEVTQTLRSLPSLDYLGLDSKTLTADDIKSITTALPSVKIKVY